MILAFHFVLPTLGARTKKALKEEPLPGKRGGIVEKRSLLLPPIRPLLH